MTQSPIRLPNRDVIAIVESLPDAGEIEKYLFNDIGGTELINLIRNDSVSGINFSYSVISDLASNDQLFDPSFLLINKGKYQSEFDKYGIRLSTRIPETNYYYSNSLPTAPMNVATNVYYDETLKALVIEFENMNSTEFVEIQVLSNEHSTTNPAKIYKVRENDY